MKIIKNIFAVQILLAALLIQITGTQEYGGENIYSADGILRLNWLFGFPKPFIKADGLDITKAPVYQENLSKNEPVPVSAFSARIFAPPQDNSNFNGWYYARSSLFLWRHDKFYYCTVLLADVYSYYPFRKYVVLYWPPDKFTKYIFKYHLIETNPGLPLTGEVVCDEVGDPNGKYRELQEVYIPWRCLLFDLAYVCIITALAVLLARGKAWQRHRYRWTCVFILTQVLIAWGIYNVLSWNMIRSYDYCWFNQILYITNCMAIFSLLLYLFGLMCDGAAYLYRQVFLKSKV